MGLIDPLLAQILVCPVDHARLLEDVPSSRLVCTSCGRRYPVEDGIPVMLVDEAELPPKSQSGTRPSGGVDPGQSPEGDGTDVV